MNKIDVTGPVDYQERCTFCNGKEEADGYMGLEIEEGKFIELPIGPACLERAKAHAEKSSTIWLDSPPGTVLE